MSHVEDVARLFLAAYETPDARGRYFAVYDSVPWQDIYAENGRHTPDAQLPAPLEGAPEEPTRFDFTRRDSLGVTMRGIPTTIRETFDWLKSEPLEAHQGGATAGSSTAARRCSGVGVLSACRSPTVKPLR